MGTFGPFETRPGDAGKRFPGGTVTYDARRPGDAGYRYVVKLVRRRSMTVDPVTGEAVPDRRVEEQRELFAQQREMTRPRGPAGKPDGRPRHWAAVHELGTTGEGAFAVFDCHGTNLQKLVEVRQEPLGPAELKHVVGSVLDGLQELRSFGSRCHGKLKPSNVFFGPGKRVTARPVLLSDLGPTRDATEAGDVRAVGELLYLCATREAFNPSDVAVADSPDWQRFGPAGQTWRELCARLVHPVPSQRPTLDDARALTAAVPVPRDRRWVQIPVAAALVLLLGLAVAFAVWHTENRARRLAYEVAYRRWAYDLVNALRQPIKKDQWYVDAAERLRYTFTPSFSKVRRDVATPVVQENKEAVTDELWTRLLERYKDRPEPLADPQKLLSYNPWQAGQLRQLSGEVSGLRGEILGWPVLGRLTRRAEAFRRKDWGQLQAICQRQYDRVAAPLHDLNLRADQADAEALPVAVVAVATLDQRAGRKMDDLVALLDRLDELDASIAKKSTDPHVVGIAKALCRDLAGLAECAPTADEQSAAAEKFKYRENVPKREVDEEAQALALERVLGDLGKALRNDPLDVAAKLEVIVGRGEWYGQNNPTPTAPGKPYLDQLKDLIAWNAGYLSRDPRKQSEVAGKLERLQARLSSPELASAVAGLRDGPYARSPAGTSDAGAAVAAFEARLKELDLIRGQLAALDERKFPADEKAIVDQLADLTRRADRLDVDGLQRLVKATADRARKFDQEQAVAMGKAMAFQDERFDKAAVKGVADVWRRAWLPKLRSAAGTGSPAGTGAAGDRFEVAAGLLQAYVDEPPPPPLTTNPTLAPYVAALQARLMNVLKAAWPAIKADMLTGGRSDDVLLTKEQAVNPSALQVAREAARAEFHRRAGAVTAAAGAAGEVRDRLDRCERFTGPWLADGGSLGAATRDLVARLQGAKLTAEADAELAGLLRQCEGYAEFERIDAGVGRTPPVLAPNDRVKLVRALRDETSPIELRYNAWLVLGDVTAKRPVGAPAWPAAAGDELEVERTARRALAQGFAARGQQLPDGGTWRAKRQDELRRTGLPTLRRLVEATAHGMPPVEAAKAVREIASPEVMSDFEVGETQLRAGLSGPLKVALALEALRRADATPQPAAPAGQDERGREPVKALAAELEGAAKWQLSAPDGTDFWFGRDEEAQRLRAKYDAMAKQLRARLAGPTAPPAAVPPPAAPRDFAAAGLGLLKWTPKPGPNDTVTYQSPATVGPKSVAIAFAPVPGTTPTPGQSQPYLATTELSIEMTNAIMASASLNRRPADPWKRWMSLAAVQEGFDTDPDNEGRKGPRAWSWGRKAGPTKSGELVPTDAWMAGNEYADHYPQADGVRKNRLRADAPGGNPQLSHPLHRLCPSEAVYLAALANARLPAEAEWKAAYKFESDPARGPTPRWNLRDQAFNDQVAFMRVDVEVRKTIGYYYPDVSTFVPAPSPLPDGLSAPTPGRAPADGVLWFCPVDGGYGPPLAPGPAPGTTFKHLVGNVAEFVAKVAPPQPAEIKLDPGNASRWTRVAGRVAVMGASALSPPEYIVAGGDKVVAAPDVAFDAHGDVDGKGRSRVAYADVGIRLAIDVSGGPAVAAQPPQEQPLEDWFKAWVNQATPWDSRS